MSLPVAVRKYTGDIPVTVFNKILFFSEVRHYGIESYGKSSKRESMKIKKVYPSR